MKEFIITLSFITIAGIVSIFEFPFDKNVLHIMVIVAIIMWQVKSYKLIDTEI